MALSVSELAIINEEIQESLKEATESIEEAQRDLKKLQEMFENEKAETIKGENNGNQESNN